MRILDVTRRKRAQHDFIRVLDDKVSKKIYAWININDDKNFDVYDDDDNFADVEQNWLNWLLVPEITG